VNIRQSYGQSQSGTFFLRHSVVVIYQAHDVTVAYRCTRKQERRQSKKV